MPLTPRREFLRRSAACTLLLTPLSYLGAEDRAKQKSGDAGKPAPGDKMHFGLVTYLWGKDWTLPTLIKNCTMAKVLGVELRTTHAHGVERDLSKEQRREVRKQFADSPVKLVGIGSNERFDNPDPGVLKKAIEATKEFIRLSHDVGGSGVKVKPDRFHESVPRQKTIEQIGKALRHLGRYGKDLGQEIRLEVHGQCSPLPIIKQIIDVAGHPSVRVCWNSNNADLAGKGLQHNFNLVKQHFGKTAHVRRLDEKSYPYQKLVRLFVEMDYDGWVMLEARGQPKDRVAALQKQREVFERMVKKAQGGG